MKHLSFLIITTACLFACTKQRTNQTQNQSIVISILHDKTDTLLLHPAAAPILALYKFDHNANTEATFRYQTISDKRLSPVITVHIADGNMAENGNDDDPYSREKMIKSFYARVRNCIDGSNKSEISTLPYSECYQSIVAELNRLNKYHCTGRLLIVYSNIFEHSSLFNCYTKEGKSLLESNPKKVAAMLENGTSLPAHLAKMRVIFVFNPRNRHEDRMFLLMANVYKIILEKRGITVHVQAQNDNYGENNEPS